jgi:hypothetical protein
MAEEKRRRRSRRSWTEKEDAQVIASLQQNTKLQDVANELEGKLDRSWGAIMNRARILSQDLPDFQKGRTRKRWTIEDDQYLRDHWGQQTSQEIAEILGRSEGAIKMRVSVLGFARRRRKSSAS